MSDGNFNRALLPHTPYASGLKAGKAMARMWAMEAFEEWLQTAQPEQNADERRKLVESFGQLLSKRER